MLIYYFIFAILIVTGILLIRRRRVVEIFTLLFLVSQVALVFYAFYHRGTTDLAYFNYDALGLIFLSVLTIISITTVYHGFANLGGDTTRRYQNYHAALCVLITAITGATIANNITVVWVFVEATTLAVSVLIYHERNKLTLEATWKYIFVCSTGIALAYMGILFLSITFRGGATFDLSFAGMARMVTSANPLYLKVAFLFVLVGYSTKMELFPMHTVGIDANSVAPPQIGAFISTAMVNLGFIAIFRVYKVLANTSVAVWMNNVLILVGLLSIIVAAGYMLKAKHNKRMLAYSTVENMGIVAIAIGAGGIGYYAAILHLILHSFTKASLFYQVGQLYKFLKTYRLEESGRYLQLNPAGAIVLLIGMFAILAIPPSGMFISEWMTFKALVASGRWITFSITILFLSFVIYALATRFFHLLYSEPVKECPVPVENGASPWETITQFVLLGFVVFICFYQPAFLVDLIREAVGF